MNENPIQRKAPDDKDVVYTEKLKMDDRNKTIITAKLADISGISTSAIKENRIQCRECGSIEYEFIETPELTHYGKYACLNCGAFIQWISKPKSHKRKIIPLRSEIDYCELCLRKRKELPDNCTLHEHHVLPFETYPKLDLVKQNRWVLCTDCHKFIHFLRKVMRRREDE